MIAHRTRRHIDSLINPVRCVHELSARRSDQPRTRMHSLEADLRFVRQLQSEVAVFVRRCKGFYPHGFSFYSRILYIVATPATENPPPCSKKPPPKVLGTPRSVSALAAGGAR